MKGNIIVGQSGGPTAAINSSLAGVYRTAIDRGAKKVYGMRHGIQGLLNEDYIDLSEHIQTDLDVELLKRTPAAYLGSCRYKLPEIHEDIATYDKIFSILDKLEIECFIYIGGNDSMDTVLQLSRYLKEKRSDIQIIGVPKTIDNDLPVTDHTPGFGSSAKYLYHTMHEIVRDSEIYPVKNVVIVEVMGRNSGWLTLAAGLTRFNGGMYPQIIAIPEVPFDEFGFLDQIKKLLKTEHTVVCAISEGIRGKNGDYIGMETKSGAVDTFGHTYLSGVGKYLEMLVSEKIGCKVRSIELNVMQRCAAHLSSKTDLDEAVKIGEAAVRAAEDGASGVTMVFERISDAPYTVRIGQTDVANIANLAKDVPEKWYDLSSEKVQAEIRRYLLPLIAGSIEPVCDETGLPIFLDIRGIHGTRG